MLYMKQSILTLLLKIQQTLTLSTSNTSNMWIIITLLIDNTAVATAAQSVGEIRAVKVLCHVSPWRISKSIERLTNCLVKQIDDSVLRNYTDNVSYYSYCHTARGRELLHQTGPSQCHTHCHTCLRSRPQIVPRTD